MIGDISMNNFLMNLAEKMTRETFGLRQEKPLNSAAYNFRSGVLMALTNISSEQIIKDLITENEALLEELKTIKEVRKNTK